MIVHELRKRTAHNIDEKYLEKAETMANQSREKSHRKVQSLSREIGFYDAAGETENSK